MSQVATQNENLVVIGQGVWMVRSQAGFRKLVKRIMERNGVERNVILGHPSKYPCVVQFEPFYRGYHGFEVVSQTVNKYVNSQIRTLETLLENDTPTKDFLTHYKFGITKEGEHVG